MVRVYKPYIPRGVGEIIDQLGFMRLSSPNFADPVFPGRNIDTVFFQLSEGLKNIRRRLGEERFQALTSLAERVRAQFESDPHDDNGGAREGRRLLREMEEVLEKL